MEEHDKKESGQGNGEEQKGSGSPSIFRIVAVAAGIIAAVGILCAFVLGSGEGYRVYTVAVKVLVYDGIAWMIAALFRRRR